MLFLVVYPFILAVIGRMIIPRVGEALIPYGIAIEAHYPALMIFFVVMNPIIFGAIMGLMLLDERETRVLSVVQVLPIRFAEYLLVKAALFTVLSVISGMIITASIGLYEVPIGESLLINCVSALGVLFGMLLINMFATNKVEGFATLKASGFLLLIPVVALYVPEPYLYLCGLAPAFWPAMALASYSPYCPIEVNRVLYLLIGTAYLLGLSYFMYKRLLEKLNT